MTDLGNRQIHLDFHTSGSIDPIASRFDADAFATRLADADVTSVNVFAKCHHGYSYYPTDVGTVHPGLSRDLLGEQLTALRRRGIKAPVYVSVLWDDLAGVLHPEWIATDRQGRLLAQPPFSGASVMTGGIGWTVMDLASGFAGYVLDQVREICERYRPDGIWFDIVSVVPSYSPASLARMRGLGIDVTDEAAVEAHYLGIRDGFIADARAVIDEFAPGASLVVNHTVDAWLSGTTAAQTQLDVESLPTSGNAWGYTHYPVYARYARTFGRPIVGMTGRFHRSWADFGGLKTRDQLRYEIGTILAAGGGVCVGDQLDPDGELDGAVYRTIGDGFARVKALDPWLTAASPRVEAAVVAAWIHDSHDPGRRVKALSPGVTGACQILGELAVQYDVIDAGRLQPGAYLLIVIPDDATLSGPDARAIDAAVAAGAVVLTAGAAVFDAAGDAVLEGVPARSGGWSATTPVYLRTGSLADAQASELDRDYPYASYRGALTLRPLAGADSEGSVLEARFNRTWEHFTSHAHAPVSQELVGPLVCRGGRFTVLATPAFSDYALDDYWVTGELIRQTLVPLLPERLLSHDGPPWLEASLLSQEATSEHPGRDVIHLVAFQPRRISTSVPRVDRGHPLGRTTLRVTAKAPPSAVYLAPDLVPVPYVVDGSVVEITLAEVEPSTVIVVEGGRDDRA